MDTAREDATADLENFALRNGVQKFTNHIN
jgi:hypothetical protein